MADRLTCESQELGDSFDSLPDLTLVRDLTMVDRCAVLSTTLLSLHTGRCPLLGRVHGLLLEANIRGCARPDGPDLHLCQGACIALLHLAFAVIWLAVMIL